MFDRLFKAAWQHRNPEIRLDAIARLPAGDPVLATLARDDADLRVRKAALARVDDLALLLALSTDGNADIRQAVLARLGEKLSADSLPDAGFANFLADTHATHWQALLPFITHPQRLFVLLERLDDAVLYARLALEAATPALREQAAQHVSEPALLRQLARDGRDKKVVQFARDLLKQQQEESGRQALVQQRVEALLEQLQQHAGHSPDPLYAARLAHLETQWQELENSASASQQKTAATCIANARKQLQALEEEAATKAATQTLARCTEGFRQFQNALAQAGREQEALAAQLADLDQQWQTASQITPATPEQRRQHDEAHSVWQVATAQWAAWQALQAEPSPDAAAMQSQLAHWPDGVARPAGAQSVPAAAPAKPASAPASARHKPAHGGLLHALRQAVNARRLKEANHVWQRLEKALENQPDAAALQQANTLKEKLDELRDWQAFATHPKKNELCVRMEMLVATPLSHPEEQANAIQALHDEWHALMSGNQAADQTLWDRFKLVSDQAYDHCRDYFRALDAKRAAMLVKRQELVSQLDAFLAGQSADTADAATLWQVRRQAPGDWQALSPVRFTDAREVNQRFHRLLKQMDTLLDAISLPHQQALEGLLEKFVALADQTDANTAAQAAMTLQQQWRAIGWAHPRAYQKLEKRRRQLCDNIFARRQALKDAEHQQEQQLVDELQQELDHLKALLETPASDEPVALDAAMRQLREKEVPASANALRQQKQTLLKQASQQQARQQREQHWRAWRQLIVDAADAPASPALRELCVAMEVSAGCPSPADAHAERLAWQVGALARSMKSKTAPADACQQLLEDRRALLAAGLDAGSRQRLLDVLRSLADNAS